MLNDRLDSDNPSKEKIDDLEFEKGIRDLADELCNTVTAYMLRQGAEGQNEPDVEAEGSSKSKNTAWILCIDDDVDFTWALKMRLEPHGVAIVRAKEGMEGYRSAFLDPPQAILMDYEMPNGQGDYVLRRLKETAATQDVPVIMITGHRDKMLERKVMNMGAARFLNKPIDFEELLTELKLHIPHIRREHVIGP